MNHNTTTWEITLEGFKNFRNNTMGAFKAPSSLVKAFNNFATTADKTKAFLAIANTYIDAMRTVPQARQLNYVPWAYLEADTRLALQEGVYGAVQHAVLNRQIYERINAGNITTNNFQVNTDTTNWLLNTDVFGVFVHNSITISGINDYRWISDAELLTITTANGNTKIIGRLDDSDISNLGKGTN